MYTLCKCIYFVEKNNIILGLKLLLFHRKIEFIFIIKEMPYSDGQKKKSIVFMPKLFIHGYIAVSICVLRGIWMHDFDFHQGF